MSERDEVQGARSAEQETYQWLGECSSTAQRSNLPAQPIIQSFRK